MIFEMKAGRGPIIMKTTLALQKLGETMDKKELKHLESEAWEDFLDMTCGQANLWCATNTEPEKKRLRDHAHPNPTSSDLTPVVVVSGALVPMRTGFLSHTSGALATRSTTV